MSVLISAEFAAPEVMNESMEILLKVFILMFMEAVILSPLP